MKVRLFLRAVSDFDVMNTEVLGYDAMSAGILEPEDGRNKLLWKVSKYLPIHKTSYLRTLES
jgi:hypothetical protein